MKRRGGRGSVLTQERHEKGSGVDWMTKGTSLPGEEECDGVQGGGEGGEKGQHPPAKSLGGPGPSPESERGETEEVTLPSPRGPV